MFLVFPAPPLDRGPFLLCLSHSCSLSSTLPWHPFLFSFSFQDE